MKHFILLVTLSFLSLAPAFGASITWGSDDDFYDHTGSLISSGSAFLYMIENATGQVPTFSNGSWDLSGATLIGSATLGDDGYIDVETTVDYSTQYKPGADSGYSYVMIVTSGTGDVLSEITSGWYFVTDEMALFNKGSMDPTDPSVSEGTLWFTEDGLSGWQEMVAIPEPTALALLALGVAGLVLRRRM